MRNYLMGMTAATLLASCAVAPTEAERQARAEAMFKRDFAKGNAALLARVSQQDEAQRLCSSIKPLSAESAAKLEAAQLGTIKYPASGKLMGDWREGEKIAQDGWGLRFTDGGQPDRKNGGACYNCHQLAPQELSYGTVAPSLYHFGKLRGNSPEMQKYAYGKVYNAQAFTACSTMPRFGHNAILTEKQMQDVVALLMDPESPVNK